MRRYIQALLAVILLNFSEVSVSSAAEKPVKLESAQSACFERSYTADHLKNHPKQTVRWIRIEHPASNNDEIYAEVKARFVGDRRLYSDGGVCSYEEKGMLICGIDCDGGGYSLSERDDGKVILKPIHRIRVTACGGDDEKNRPYREILPADDQNMFVLERVNAKKCKLIAPQ